jgi:catechol 2,3-dioxygenase-like lactoylglutathione lyase family enzyme
MSNILQITPFIHVQDIAEALDFFNDILGFETRFQMGNYAYVQRETAGIRLMEETGPDGAPPGNRRFAYYVDVRDVDRLFAELKPKLDTLPADYVHGPLNQPYGQREFMVVAPDGNLIVFGEAIRERPIEVA